MKIFATGLIAVAAFSLGLGAARLIESRQASDVNQAMAAFYDPYSQFILSAATVNFVATQRNNEAVALNCRAMRIALRALEVSRDSNQQNARRLLDHLVQQGRCPK